MELQEKLKQEAIELGLCQEWTDDWGNPDSNELCEKFIKGIDFCIKHRWPSADFIKEHFDKFTLQQNGIFVEDGTAVNLRHVVVLGNARVKIIVGSHPCDLTVLDNGCVSISVLSDRLCYVSAYDNCEIKVEYKNPQGRLAMSYFGGSVKCKEYFDKINIKER